MISVGWPLYDEGFHFAHSPSSEEPNYTRSVADPAEDVKTISAYVSSRRDLPRRVVREHRARRVVRLLSAER
jgi:hypothetical protein